MERRIYVVYECKDPSKAECTEQGTKVSEHESIGEAEKAAFEHGGGLVFSYRVEVNEEWVDGGLMKREEFLEDERLVSKIIVGATYARKLADDEEEHWKYYCTLCLCWHPWSNEEHRRFDDKTKGMRLEVKKKK